ncbi:NUDIX domain-containing protein [Agrococcus sp. HG114]|uniref:NUDIX domain-containing protein n=1 Tax=Agrococcus sp. HG114 TaxID=2969757 RepID=UPI00215A21B0|nr:NUDIX domain-containing protein [Agrococcus sp. HG114]MCR8671881.1 NUDIX domain-containing protein [Agrococcus sp. HG114]
MTGAEPLAPPERIRAIAIAAIRRADGALLVTSTVDPATGRTLVRPPGGGIDPGELAADAVVRELHEELGLEVAGPRLLGVLESIVGFAGRARHEHMFVFAVEVAADASWPSTTDAGHPVWWLEPARFADAEIDLVPVGLVGLLGAAPA